MAQLNLKYLIYILIFILSSVEILSADDNYIWKTNIVDDSNLIGNYTSIALDSKGNPHIAYFDITFPDTNFIRYAYFDGTAWHIEKVAIAKIEKLAPWVLSLLLVFSLKSKFLTLHSFNLYNRR